MKANFWTMWKLLDSEDWEVTPRIFNDIVSHKHYDIWFFMEQSGIRYHNSKNGDVYVPNILAWYVLGFRVAKLKKKLFKPATIEKRE